MGLDGIELIMAMEEEFDILLPDDELNKVRTVDDLYKLIKARRQGITTEICLSHHMFNKVRRALMNNYQLKRSQIKGGIRLLDLVPEKDLKDGWPYLHLFEDLKIPELKFKLLFSNWSKDTTIADLVRMLIVTNSEDFRVMQESDDDIWIRYVKVIQKQLNVPVIEIRLNARFAEDLGVD